MKPAHIGRIAESWKAFRAASGVGHIATVKQYDDAITLIDVLADIGAMENGHELNDLFLLISDVVHKYDLEHYPLPQTTGAETLRFLMDQHELKQKDLALMFGSQSVVSEILNGYRELNKGHIKSLAERFGISPSVFFEVPHAKTLSPQYSSHVFHSQLSESFMASRVTSKPAARSASKTLSSFDTSAKSKASAASALSQRKAPNKETSARAATAASKALADGRSSKISKSAAASALAQKPGKARK